MKVLFDVNVIIDIWGKTEDFAFSLEAMDVAIVREFELCITASMTPSIVCLLSARKLMSRKDAREAFGNLASLVEILDVGASDCLRAHSEFEGDYEDDLIACSAKRNGVDVIVTRNKRDFVQSPVPALTPEEFVSAYKPADMEYGLVEF